jgi:hypothetical protein
VVFSLIPVFNTKPEPFPPIYTSFPPHAYCFKKPSLIKFYLVHSASNSIAKEQALGLIQNVRTEISTSM